MDKNQLSGQASQGPVFPAPGPVTRVMTLISTKGKYNSKVTPITLVDNAETAKAIAAIIERGGATELVVLTDVPIWPNMTTEED